MTRSIVDDFLAALILLLVVVVTGCAGNRDGAESTGADETSVATVSTPAPGEPDLAAVRVATERFKDVNVALAEGYIRDPGDICDSAELMGRPASDGAMGIHYIRMDLLGIAGPPEGRVSGTGTHTDFLTPGVLIYEPQADGSLELVAIGNLAFEDAWQAAGNTAPPSFHGVAYDHMVDDPATTLDEAHMFAPHYDRHVWLYRENPGGMFAQFNPNVSCEYHTGAEHTHM